MGTYSRERLGTLSTLSGFVTAAIVVAVVFKTLPAMFMTPGRVIVIFVSFWALAWLAGTLAAHLLTRLFR